MNIKKPVLDYTRYKQPNWYGHVRTINEERLSRKSLEKREDLENRGCRSNNWDEREGN